MKLSHKITEVHLFKELLACRLTVLLERDVELSSRKFTTIHHVLVIGKFETFSIKSNCQPIYHSSCHQNLTYNLIYRVLNFSTSKTPTVKSTLATNIRYLIFLIEIVCNKQYRCRSVLKYNRIPLSQRPCDH